MKTAVSGIVMKLKDCAYGAIATLSTGEEVRVSHKDYWRYLEAKENAPSGYEVVPYLNSYHLVAIPNPVYQEEE